MQIVDEALLLIIIHVSLVYRVDINSGSGNGCKYISIADISYKNRSSKQVLTAVKCALSSRQL